MTWEFRKQYTEHCLYALWPSIRWMLASSIWAHASHEILRHLICLTFCHTDVNGCVNVKYQCEACCMLKGSNERSSDAWLWHQNLTNLQKQCLKYRMWQTIITIIGHYFLYRSGYIRLYWNKKYCISLSPHTNKICNFALFHCTLLVFKYDKCDCLRERARDRERVGGGGLMVIIFM